MKLKFDTQKVNMKDPCIGEPAATAQPAGAQSEHRDEEPSQGLVARRQRGERR